MMKKTLNALIFLNILIALSVMTGFAQSKQSKVQSKDDEFSAKRKVTLTDLAISPQLSMTLTSTIDNSRKGTRGGFEPDLDFAEVNFTSMTGKREYDGSDTEFNFLVDGTRVKGGPVSSSPMTDHFAQDGKEIAVGTIYLSTLERVSKGREVKIKIGDNVYQLDKDAIQSLREFVKAVGR